LQRRKAVLIVDGSLSDPNGFDDAFRNVLFQVNPKVAGWYILPPRSISTDLCARKSER
jgi:hypothetical protein